MVMRCSVYLGGRDDERLGIVFRSHDSLAEGTDLTGGHHGRVDVSGRPGPTPDM
jgi:hypothetical protein